MEELTRQDIQEEVKRFFQCRICKRKIREEIYELLALPFIAMQQGWIKNCGQIYCPDCKERG